MRWVTEYRRLAAECRQLAAALTKPTDRRALELMAKGWDKSADEREAKLRGGGDQSDARPSSGFQNALGALPLFERISVCFYIADLDMVDVQGFSPPISCAEANSESLLEQIECAAASS
jgi:hypothetical protein